MAVHDNIAVADGDENICSAGKSHLPLFNGTPPAISSSPLFRFISPFSSIPLPMVVFSCSCPAAPKFSVLSLVMSFGLPAAVFPEKAFTPEKVMAP